MTPLNRACLFCDTLFKRTGCAVCLTYVIFTISATYHINKTFCFAGNKILTADGPDVGFCILECMLHT